MPNIDKTNENKVSISCKPNPSIKVLTYNVRYGSDYIENFRKLLGKLAVGDYLPWSSRYPEIRNRINTYAPDLIGLQEMHTENDISHIVSLDQYQLISYQFGDFQYGDAALLFRKERFELLDSGQLWLGPNKNLPFSLGFKPFAMIRYVNWVVLRDKANNFSFIFVNTHFDNNPVNKENSSDLFFEQITKLTTHYPIIVTGDFNSKAVTERYKRLIGLSKDQPSLINTYDLDTQIAEQNAHPNDLIDHILVGGPCSISVSNWLVDKRPLDTGDTLSDHDPVMAEIYFNGIK